MKRKVLNTSQYVSLAVIDGQTYRFAPKEAKALGTEVVSHSDFSKYPDLQIVGDVKEIIPFVEVSPEPVKVEERPKTLVVDDITEKDEAKDNEVEVKPKRKSQRSNKSNTK